MTTNNNNRTDVNIDIPTTEKVGEIAQQKDTTNQSGEKELEKGVEESDEAEKIRFRKNLNTHFPLSGNETDSDF